MLTFYKSTNLRLSLYIKKKPAVVWVDCVIVYLSHPFSTSGEKQKQRTTECLLSNM